MEQVKVRIEVDAAVAVRSGGARAGRGFFTISEAQLAELTEAQREVVAACATVDTSTSWYSSQRRLVLAGAISWESVKGAILASEAAEAEATRKAAEAREAAVQQLLHGPLHPQQLAGALALACTNLGAYLDGTAAASVLLGRIAAKSDDPRVTAWLDEVRPKAQAARAAELETFAAQVREAPARFDYQSDESNQFWGTWGSATMGEVRATMGEWWTNYRNAKQARIAREAADAAAAREAAAQAEKTRVMRLMLWAAQRSPSIAEAVAEGYEQTAAARTLLDDTITDGLSDPEASPAVWTDAEKIAARNSVSDAALGVLKATRERAKALEGQLPEGVTLTVGRISRQVYAWHDEVCDPDGECGPGCCEKKRTVVAVTVTGRSAQQEVVAVPVE